MVLNVSGHIDFWMELVAGEQTEFLFYFDERWKKWCVDQEEEIVIKGCEGVEEQCTDCNKEEHVDEGVEGSQANDKLRNLHFGGEKAHLESRFAKIRQRYWHLEQNITFMGCSMEYVRSKAAHWVKNIKAECSVWNCEYI